ncbi:M48 family metalloprotease [Streptomyces turgidiscabies]|uniref:Zn-dependent protease with chaperone function n=1 Tax=Streptomyces turgidiscabies TaxID=85558 RepID=A0ABU0RH98_9ACTN|nr:M48 family metalloprotease [Streptomyces turgidiscabies]MDQ0930360.1 Zn-dependent protease with chaperone function [Streptomyces turgidiscabies]
MTHPPASPPEHPEPSEQPLFPPTYPEQSAPPYPQATHKSPQYPAPAKQPQYPDPSQPPAYPTQAQAHPPSYPTPTPTQAQAQPPSYPNFAEPPTYPSATHPETDPGTTQPPQYPGTTQPETNPGVPQPPQYPNATHPPTYPTATPTQPPTYPGATPNPTPPPAYPGTTPTQPPPYPQATTQPIPPQYAPPQQPPAAAPTAPTPPNPPFPPPTATTPTPTSPPPPAPPTEHPHHISTDRGRVHIAAHQRRTDATAVGNLLLYLPNFLCSLLVVSLFSLFFSDLAILVIIAWILSGALVFHRPTESALARRLLHLRYPTPQERAKLEPVWREVTARAGVEGRNYELWVEDSDGLNAVAAAGHIVGVTRFAMNELPNGELAAVMAHELGHHVGGHAWSGLLGYWYAQPGRIAWRFLRAFSGFVFQVSRAFSCFGVGFVVLVLGGIAMATISTLYGLPLLILGVPYALAAVGRRAELRADEHAAALGFAPMLASVLGKLHQEEQRQTAALAALNNGVAPEESPLSKLLSSHPDYHTRLHHLQPYLQQQR